MPARVLQVTARHAHSISQLLLGISFPDPHDQPYLRQPLKHQSPISHEITSLL